MQNRDHGLLLINVEMNERVFLFSVRQWADDIDICFCKIKITRVKNKSLDGGLFHRTK